MPAHSSKEYMKAYRAANAERLKAQTKAWRDAHPQYKVSHAVACRAYYHGVIKNDPVRSARMREASASWTKNNPDRVNQRKRERDAKHREELAAKARAYYWAHHDEQAAKRRSEERKAYQKAYREAHREKLVEHSRQYYAAHREQHAEHRAQNYAAKREEYIARAEQRQRALSDRGTHTKQDIENLYDTQHGLCAGCGKTLARTRSRRVPDGYEVDHVLPVKLGGMNTADNLQLLCRPCNRKKHAKHPDEWRQEIHALPSSTAGTAPA